MDVKWLNSRETEGQIVLLSSWAENQSVDLSSQENLSSNTESGLSFKSKTCEVGVFSICTLLRGFGRGSESAVKEEATLQMKAPEHSGAWGRAEPYDESELSEFCDWKLKTP